MNRCLNRLTVIGTINPVQQFQRSRWESKFKAKFTEPLEWSAGRFICQFETDDAPLERLKTVSRRWPKLTFLLDYELERQRIKGLAKAREDNMEQCGISY